MILITGATGHLGRAVIQQLIRKTAPENIAAFVRDEAKASDLKGQGVSVRAGDYSDPAALRKAMQGVEKVLLISGGEAPDALQQHLNVVDAAKAAGVACVAYTGRALKDPNTLVNALMQRHFQTEDYIRESGMTYAFFRNALYTDVLPQFVGGPRVFEAGIAMPAGDGRVAFALRSEMGEAIANVLAGGDCENRTYHFTGAEAYSMHDVSAAIATLSGKAVRYTDAAPVEYQEGMRSRGLPDAVIQKISAFVADIAQGQESIVCPDLEQALGRPPASLQEGLRQIFPLPQQAAQA